MGNFIDNDIVLSAINGDKKAFGIVCKEYRKRIIGYFRQLGVKENDIDDVSQDFWIRIAENISSLNQPEALHRWLFKIAKNKSTDYHRNKYIDNSYSLTTPLRVNNEEIEGERDVPYLVDLDAKMDASVTLSYIYEAAKTDHFIQSTVLYAEGYSYKEVEDRVKNKIDINSVGTVKSRINRGRQRLAILFPSETVIQESS
jgi:RNA polymerase sigma-70 factor (ECF subfamily)